MVDRIIWDRKKLDMMLFGSKCIEMSEMELPMLPESFNGGRNVSAVLEWKIRPKQVIS